MLRINELTETVFIVKQLLLFSVMKTDTPRRLSEETMHIHIKVLSSREFAIAAKLIGKNYYKV